jgi:hypothetical protein
MIEEVFPLPERKARPSEVNIKMIAALTVTLCKKEVAPAPPKTYFMQEGGCPGTSENRLTRTSKDSAHICSLASLK